MFILIIGASGSGTTTVGKALAAARCIPHFDIDDYFWQPTDPPFVTPRPREERLRLLTDDLERAGSAVLSGSFCGWGDSLIPRLNAVVRIVTPTTLRLERLKAREYAAFGERIRPGGDMAEGHAAFLTWAAMFDTAGPDTRSRALLDRWLAGAPCPCLEVDGSRPVGETIEKISVWMGKDGEK